MKIRYIQRKGVELETVDELPYSNTDERKEFKRVLNEYRISDPYASYYGSQRCCKDWK